MPQKFFAKAICASNKGDVTDKTVLEDAASDASACEDVESKVKKSSDTKGAESELHEQGDVTASPSRRQRLKFPKVPNRTPVREYVKQRLSPELDVVVKSMLSTLMEYQKKAHANGTLTSYNRRLVFGIREVDRAIRTKKARVVILATDIEEIKTEGGLDSRIQAILDIAHENEIPIIFSMNRRKLGKSMRAGCLLRGLTYACYGCKPYSE